MSDLYHQLQRLHSKIKPPAKGGGTRRAREDSASELDGTTWLRYSISVWDDVQRSAEEREHSHPAMFPVELVERIVTVFARNKGDLVLDPFAGSGSTLVGAARLGRRVLGLEISKRFANIARQRLGQYDLWRDSKEKLWKITEDDARNLEKHVQPESVDMCLTSPPYWDILTQKRTADYKKVRHYGDLEADLGRIKDYKTFLDELDAVFRQVFNVLKPDKYCIVVVMDLRKKDKFYPFHSDLARRMEHIGFELDDVIIWNRAREYNNLRPLGYPHVFRVNKVHEFIMIFQKRSGQRRKRRSDAR